jgi:hypothetical protein
MSKIPKYPSFLLGKKKKKKKKKLHGFRHWS